ncbi:MAG: peptide-methionine (S)-S-oxide reductase MsrA [Opitutales bacterium]
MENPSSAEIATFGAGCFWCVEAVFDRIEGVHKVTSGYMGGATENPTYQQVCNGDTGHAEVVQVTFDPEVRPYADLVKAFFALHDPTQRNRQGADVGTQYRSAIFTHSEAQRETAEEIRQRLNAEQFGGTIATEITPASTFYPAEAYHQEYYQRNAGAPYCQFVIEPKLRKLGLS